MVQCEKNPIAPVATTKPVYEFDRVYLECNRSKNKFLKCTACFLKRAKTHNKGGVGRNLSERVGRFDQVHAETVGRIEKGKRCTNKILRIRITKAKL